MGSPEADAILDGWHSKSIIERWLLPRDFRSEVQSGDTVDQFDCIRYTTKYLTVSERESTRTLKPKDRMKYRTSYDYVPADFKNETVHVILDEADVNCHTCHGRGTVDCPREVVCQSCRGIGEVQEQCRHCTGSGIIIVQNGDRVQRVRCRHCTDGIYSGKCTRCMSPFGTAHGSTGRVTCPKCNGSGELPCRRCASEGFLIQARILTRKFSSRTDVAYQVDGAEGSKFRNGVKRHHFWRLKGNLLSDKIDDNPDIPSVIRRQETIDAYDVSTATFTYKGKPFTVTAIEGDTGRKKYITSKVPFAKKKLAAYYAASAILGIAVLGALLAIPALV